MELNTFFNIVLFAIISVLLVLIIKAYFITLTIHDFGEQHFISLQNQFDIEQEKSKLNTRKLVLVDDLNKSLTIRLFEIAEKLILIQKIIFEKRIN